ncbi:MAG: hypothetical protein HY371_02125 [Devosia nanyangense]|nr:hypothetical protein [Devosia nanyangense]
MIVHDNSILEALLRGATHYLDLGNGAEAAVYYGIDGGAAMLAPNGTRRSGRWVMSPTGYHVDWEGGPSADWQIDIEPGRIGYRDGDGVEKGRVTKIVPGNAIAA